MAAHTISEEEATRDFAQVMDHIRAGEEVVIESGEHPLAVIRPAIQRRTITESIAILKARSKERGYEAVMDEDFAADMEEIIRKRKPADRSAWD